MGLEPIMQAKYEIISMDGDESSDELIAVITAAVAASLNRSTHSLVVRSVKQVPTSSPAWNRAARLDLTRSWFS
ncbi:MAG: hypothetical protein GX815_02365 [Clostridiales bacterium]|nr:hypothetical protein [Clostridiales bacterium]